MSSTLYLILAELTVLIHFLFVAFVVIGALAVLKWPRLIYLHLLAVAWGIYIELSGGICPLTPLENHFRYLAGMDTYTGGFINHYLMPILYPRELTREVQIGFAILVIVVNLLLYSVYVYRLRTTRQ